MEEIRFNVDRARAFSALQRAENSSMRHLNARCPESPSVSVLFSEPKIPQFISSVTTQSLLLSFSALQRAENSSISIIIRVASLVVGFSALQRAENSSIGVACAADDRSRRFQCSSASRKFLNDPAPAAAAR